MTNEQKLAVEFSCLVVTELADHLSAIIETNTASRAKGDYSTCATHDYCDANMLMGEAFETVTGHEPSSESDEDAALWNAAWDIACRANFFKA